MAARLVSDDVFLEAWLKFQSAVKVSQCLGITVRNVYARRRKLEQLMGRELLAKEAKGPLAGQRNIATFEHYRGRIVHKIDKGVVIVFSDAHFWPGERTTAFRGLLKLCKEMKPSVVVCNGDAFDGSQISRFQRIGWDQRPSVRQELDACDQALTEIHDAAKGARLYWPLGNHDCLDTATECLTKRGWLKHNELAETDEVLSLDGSICKWTPINEIVSYPFSGDLVRIEKTRMSMAVTPNHRVILDSLNWRSKKYDTREFRRADDLPWSFNLPTAGTVDAPISNLTDEQIALAGWILTDGNFDEYNISIYQSKPEGRQEIPRLLDALGYTYSTYVRQRQATVVCGRQLLKPSLEAAQYFIRAESSKIIWEWLPMKDAVPQWAHDLDDRQFKIFLDAIIAGDGVWDGNVAAKTCAVIYGKERFLSSLQAICVQHGWRARLAKDNRGDYRLCLSKEPKIRIERPEIFREAYEGIVWCLRVPLGNFMVRRNGCAYFTGNSRFEIRIANTVPEYDGVAGFTLKERFPEWMPCWSVWMNENTVIKHRFKSGIHAPHNNTMWAGKNIITGHLHSLKVYPLTDYNGDRWGVDTGTLSHTYGQKFEGYLEDSPRNWRSGFVVATFHKGEMLWPEVVRVKDEDSIDFRGQVIKV